MFNMQFKTSNDAFEDMPGAEIARILRDVADQFDGSVISLGATIKDINGNYIGTTTYNKD